MIGAAIAGAAVGGGLNYMSTQSANRASAREAQKDRDFQERMAKTSYQNMVADLEKAGLNKALAYGNTPSKVSGSTASQSAAHFDSPDFVGALTKRAQRDLADAQVQSAFAQAELLKSQNEKTIAETGIALSLLPEQMANIKSQTARNTAEITSNPIKLGQSLFEKLVDSGTGKAIKDVFSGNTAKKGFFGEVKDTAKNIKRSGVNQWVEDLFFKPKPKKGPTK